VSERPLLVASDLDGCLLEEESYSFEAARPALGALAQARVPLVLASSKTWAEMAPLARRMGLDAPMIVENGGALLIPEPSLRRPPREAVLVRGFWTVVLGERREWLVAALDAIAREAEAGVRSFASLEVAEVERLTGLPRADAGLAMRREFDEPFLLQRPEQLSRVDAAARARGLRVLRGGRFLHLTGATDKGRALARLIEIERGEGRQYRTVALGDSPNDLPLLLAAERPILVPRPDGALHPVLRSNLPSAERAPAPGPRGWNVAVIAVLRGERLPAASGT
jgi:mannosyl-3-phosphoglycerate phosphatase